MKESSLNQLLTRFGLNKKEASLYLAALSLGESGMSDLAHKAKLNRSTAYLIFKSLEERGLMGTFQNRRGARFVATRPQSVIDQAKERIEQLEDALPQLDALLPKQNQAPKVSYYQGKEGYYIAGQDSLNYHGSIVRHIGSLTEIHRVIGSEYDIDYYIPERIKRKITINCLYFVKDMKDSGITANAPEELREVRYLPEKFHFNTSSLIYGNKVAYFSNAEELITVIVESEELAQAERKKFDLIWETV